MSNINDCGCSSIQPVGVRPPNLKCPPDISTLIFQFLERKRIGIAKGTNELLSLDMSAFFMPLSAYTMQKMSLCPGDIKKIDPVGISTTGKRPQIDLFTVPEEYLGTEGTDSDLETDKTIVLTINTTITLNISAPTFAEFIANLRKEISNNAEASALVRAGAYYGETKTFELIGLIKGQELEYTLNGFSASTITQTTERYPLANVVKVLFASIEFCGDNVPSNQQFIEYAYDSDYQNNGNDATWHKTSKLIVLTGAEDVEDIDMNLIETIVLKNSTSVPVNVYFMLGI